MLAENPILPNYITELFEFKENTLRSQISSYFYEFMLLTGFSNKLIKIDFQVYLYYNAYLLAPNADSIEDNCSRIRQNLL